MKKAILLNIILVSLISLNLTGQERVNRVKLTFQKESEILENAVGWAYNSTLGEWIDYNNVISDNKDYKDKFKNLQGGYMMSKKPQNFIKIQTKSILFNRIEYYVVIIDKWEGRYKYPSLSEGYYQYKKIIGYIFSKEEYKKLHRIENIIKLTTKHIAEMNLSYEDYDEIKFLDKIQTELQKKEKEYSPVYTFPIMKSKEGNIRFYIPEYFSDYFFSKYDFDKKYFETSIDNFSKIIIQ